MRIVVGNVSDFKINLAAVGHNIERHAAVELAHVQGGVGNVVGFVAPALAADTGLQLTHLIHQVTTQVQRIDGKRRLGRMALAPMARGVQCRLALVARGQTHHGRLTHNAQVGSHRRHLEQVQ